MLGVVATLNIQEGKNNEFEQIFSQLKARVEAEETGNLMYDLFRDQKDTQTYYVMEKYADMEAFKAHGGTPHMKEFRAAMGGCLAGAPEIKIAEAV